MRIAVFSSKSYDRSSLTTANSAFGHELRFFEPRLAPDTAQLAHGFPGVCIFVNDACDQTVVADLALRGTKILATRSAGYNQIDLAAAREHGVTVARVPSYSPHAISEFTLALILTLGRRIHRAYNRTREFNFEIAGLEGFELRDKTVGVFGTGRIGQQVIENLSGFGCRILAYDKFPNETVRRYATYVDSETLGRESDILTLHCPLTPETRHIINAETLPRMKDGVFIVNTSRGALLDTDQVIEFLKRGKIGMLALDVYEEEADFFYRDLSEKVLTNDELARLITFPNVIVTSHMAFLTDHALRNIADTTLKSFSEFERDGVCANAITE